MEVFLFTYEMYWMEIAGVLMVAVLALEIVLLCMVCVLRKRLQQMGDRLHLKNEMENSRRRDLKWGNLAMGKYGVQGEKAPDSFDRMNAEKGEGGYGQKKKQNAGEQGQLDSADESELILDVLGEIFP